MRGHAFGEPQVGKLFIRKVLLALHVPFYAVAFQTGVRFCNSHQRILALS